MRDALDPDDQREIIRTSITVTTNRVKEAGPYRDRVVCLLIESLYAQLARDQMQLIHGGRNVRSQRLPFRALQ